MKRDSSDKNNLDNTLEPPSSNGHHGVVVSENQNISPEKSQSDLYAEWDEEETILAVKSALEERHIVSLIEADEDAYLKLKNNKPGFVFNIAEGLYGAGREALLPGIYEMLRIPYTGSDPLTLSICLNKARTKEILSYYSIPNARFKVFDSDKDVNLSGMEYPLMVKPIQEGSSKGIFNSSLVDNKEDLIKEINRIISSYSQSALVEEFLPGREFTVALLGNGRNVKVLPVVEFNLDLLPKDAKKIYSYEAKWEWDTLENPLSGIHICPAILEDKLKNSIEQIAKDTFNVLNCKDWCRIDLRLDKNGNPKIMELNPLPGIIPDPEAHSCFPSASKAAGITYNQMINSVLDAAFERYGLKTNN